MWHGAWRSLLFSELLLQTSNAHFCYYCDYLFMFRAFFPCCFFQKAFHICFHRQLTLLSFIWKLKKCYLHSSLPSVSSFSQKKSFIVFSSSSTLQKPICFIICNALFKSMFLLAILPNFNLTLKNVLMCNSRSLWRSTTFLYDWWQVRRWKNINWPVLGIQHFDLIEKNNRFTHIYVKFCEFCTEDMGCFLSTAQTAPFANLSSRSIINYDW